MDEPVLWSRHVLLQAHPSSPTLAREFVASHLVENGLGHLRDDVQLVVSELTTNATVHTGTMFSVRLEARPETVRLTVRDGSSRQLRRVTASVMDTSGRGLTIIRLVSHDWGVEQLPDGGTSVWATFTTRGG